MNPNLINIVSHFQIDGDVLDIQFFGAGHINTTYLVRISLKNGTALKLILQRINHHVFKEPEKVMANIERVTAHLRQQIVQSGGDPNREVLSFLQTKNGRSFYKTITGEYWRLEHFIEGAKTYQIASNPLHHYEAAYAYGRFQRMLADFPAGELYETIPDFHNTRKRLAVFETAVSEDKVHRSQAVTTEIDFIRQRSPMAPLLENLQELGQIPLLVTHNDAKLDNVMIDTATNKAVCVIDLDTVMPGIALLDFADAVRSGANLTVEDDPELENVQFDLHIYKQLAHGFLDATRQYLSPLEIDHLAFAARLITYEQAMRFLTDYLNGDTYYKTNHSYHNLHRTQNQIRLLKLMEANQVEMDEIIDNHR